ncbi:MAG: hypothetical protein ABII71_00500 [Candidatus Micrarchaeota archaeon]
MDPLSNIKVAGRIMMVLMLLTGFAFAGNTSGTENLEQAMEDLCNNARALLGIGAMLLVILAAAVYAIGQIVGAETRARASVWATAMLTGAVIGVIIYMLVPTIVATILGSDSPGDNPCAFTFT